MTVTLLLVVDTLVRTLPFCSMSIRVAPEGPTVPEEPVADAPVKVTVPKSAKGTSELPLSKSSTIHSALSSWSALLWLVKVWVTVVPLELFFTVAVPAVVEVAVTVTVMLSPAEMLIPEKSYLQTMISLEPPEYWWSHLRVVGVPLVPCVETDLRALDVEVDTSLENGVRGSVTINSNPGRGSVLISVLALADSTIMGGSLPQSCCCRQMGCWEWAR